MKNYLKTGPENQEIALQAIEKVETWLETKSFNSFAEAYDYGRKFYDTGYNCIHFTWKITLFLRKDSEFFLELAETVCRFSEKLSSNPCNIIREFIKNPFK